MPTKWPIFVKDRHGNEIYLTKERWKHALDHPGMEVRLLGATLSALKTGRRKQEPIDPTKYRYKKEFDDLPEDDTPMVVVVKFGIDRTDPSRANNFVLTAYLVQEYS